MLSCTVITEQACALVFLTFFCLIIYCKLAILSKMNSVSLLGYFHFFQKKCLPVFIVFYFSIDFHLKKSSFVLFSRCGLSPKYGILILVQSLGPFVWISWKINGKGFHIVLSLKPWIIEICCPSYTCSFISWAPNLNRLLKLLKIFFIS